MMWWDAIHHDGQMGIAIWVMAFVDLILGPLLLPFMLIGRMLGWN